MNYSLIKELSKEKGITLKDIALSIGMSEAGMYRAFTNNTLKVEALEKIAEVLKVSPRYFFGNDPIEYFRSLDSLGVKVNLIKYLQNIIYQNTDIVGHALIEIWEREPSDKRNRHWNDFLVKNNITKEKKVEDGEIIYVDSKTKLIIIIDYLLQSGYFFNMESAIKESKISARQSKSVRLKSTDVLDKTLESAIEYAALQYVGLVKSDNVIIFLVSQRLISETDLFEQTLNAFTRIFNSYPMKDGLQYLRDIYSDIIVKSV